MKKNIWMILVGVTVMHVAVFSALFVSSGCAKNEVMGDRKFVPAAGSEAPMAAPNTGAPQVTPTAPTPVAPVKADDKAADKAPVTKKEYEAMKYAGSSKPVTSAVGSSHSTAAATAAGGTYEVKSGDTIGKIANAHGISMNALLKANNLTKESAGKLKIGQKLVIPGKSAASVAAKADDKAAAKAPAAKESAAAPVKDSGNSYTVKAGDTIPKIAKSLGVKEADLKKVNNLSDAATKQLKIGQKLMIPGKEGAADTAAAAAPAVADTAAPAAAPTAPAAATPAAAPAAGGAAAAPVDTGDISTPVQLTKDMTIEEFAAEQKTTVDKIRALNQDLDKSGKLKSGQIVFVP